MSSVTAAIGRLIRKMTRQLETSATFTGTARGNAIGQWTSWSGAGEGGRDHGERGRHEQRAGHALEAAEDDERHGVRGDRAQQRGGCEARHADGKDLRLPEDVAERAADEDE